MSSNETRPLLEQSLTIGALAGVALAGLMALLYASGDEALQAAGFGHLLILWYAILRCQNRWKKEHDGASYAQLLLAGCICGLAASLFVDLYSAVYIKILRPEFADESIAQTMEMMKGMNIYSAEELRQAERLSQKLLVASTAIGTSLLYGIISLIFSSVFAFFIVRKKK